MIWKTHVVGDAIVQTCGKAGRVFTKWTRRMPSVPCAVPANWTSWPENEEHHEYGYAGKDAWANEQSLRYMQEMDEVFHPGIPSELHQAVLERTLKIVQELIGHGSDLKELKNKVWTVGNANRQCSSCGIYVSDKPEHGKKRCRGARNTTAKFNGQCCSCRFDVSTIDNCVTASHSCHTCKRRRHRWAHNQCGATNFRTHGYGSSCQSIKGADDAARSRISTQLHSAATESSGRRVLRIYSGQR
jgi:hypothetical protein